MKGIAAIAALSGLAASAAASISYTTAGGVVSENFDTLIASGANQAWVNDSTLAGWNLFRQPAPGTAITMYSAGNGGSNSGSFWSFGADASAERALGGLGSGGTYYGSPSTNQVAGWIAVAVTNDTGGSLSEFTVSYDGEQWRNGGNASAQTMVLEYGFGASFDTVGLWTAAGAGFNFTSLQNSATSSALDGNAAANRTAGLGGTVAGLSWNDGDTLWIRWVEFNDSGNDHGLSVDNFAFSAVPTPGAAVLLGLGGLAAARRRR